MNSNPPPPIVNVSPPTNPSTSPELSPPSNATTPGGMNSPPSNPPTPKLPPASPSNPPSSPAPPVPLVPPPSPPVLSPPTTPSFPSSNPPPSNPSFNESPPPPSKKKWPSPPQGEGSVENAPPAPPPPPTPYSSPPPTPYSSPPPPSGNTASPVPTNRSNSPPPPGSQGKVKNAPSVPPSRSSTSYSSPPPPFLSTSPPPSKEKWWRPPPPQGDGSIENAPPAPPPPPTPSYSSPPSPANKQPGRNPPSQGNSEEAPPAPPPSSKRKQRSPPLGTGSVESAPPAPPGSPSSSITGDPHFVGKHGERFDFHGKDGRDYCVVSDHNIHMNMHVFHGKRRKSTFISKLGILYKGQKILIDVHNNSQKSHSWTLTVDDVEMDDINTMSTRTGLTITQGINFIRIVVPEEVDILVDIVRATFGRRGSLKDYINLHVKQLAVSTEVHGILGQTYLDTAYALEKLRAAKGKKRSRAAKVLVDGSESDYLTSSILSPDCKYSNFEDQASWHSRIQRTLFESVKGLLPLHLSNRVSVVTDCVGFGDENVVCKA
ncbi:hypothetical protein KP509_29G042500 [Ceratopteris richardii]|nr:hypothetical protein KP509_29G042500 [Ceratopteris richardii]